MTVEPIRTLQVDQMPVLIFDSNKALGARAADDLAAILIQAIAERFGIPPAKAERLKRELRKTRFRPRWVNGEAEAVTGLERRYEWVD